MTFIILYNKSSAHNGPLTEVCGNLRGLVITILSY